MTRPVTAAGLRWQVTIAGSGPDLLLLHGTGTAASSWQPLLPRLASRFRCIAPDLPGHGGTEAPPPSQLTLPAMTAAVADLVRALRADPLLVVGHSAGAAIAARAALDGLLSPAGVAGLNPALVFPFAAPAALLRPFTAWLAGTEWVSRLAAARLASPAAVDRLFRQAGSPPPPDAATRYAALAANPAHIRSALAMMANWDVRPVAADLPRLAVPLLLVTGDRDPWFPPAVIGRLAATVPTASHATVPATGHFSHEERPDEVARLLTDFAAGLSRRR